MKKTNYPIEKEDQTLYKKLIKINIPISKSIQTMTKLQYSKEEIKEFRRKSFIYGVKKALIKEKGKQDLGDLEQEKVSKSLLEKLAHEEEEIYYHLKNILGQK